MPDQNISQLPEATTITNSDNVLMLTYVTDAPLGSRTQKAKSSLFINKAVANAIASLGITSTASNVSLTSGSTTLPILNFGTGLVFNNTTQTLTTASSSSSSTAVYDSTSLGITVDGTTDSTVALQTAINTINSNGGGILYIVSRTNQSIFINGTVKVLSNVELNFKVPVIYGTVGRVRVYGEQAYLPITNQPRLRASSAAGTNTLFLATSTESLVSFFAVGDQIIIRGDNNAAGLTLTDETNYIASIDSVNNNLIVLNALENQYDPTYPSSGLAGTGVTDRASVLKVSARSLASDPTVGTNSIIVTPDASMFAVGDYVALNDQERGLDTAGTSNNILRQETSRIIAISGTTITLQNNIYHGYKTAFKAQIVKVNLTSNAKIIGAKVTYPALSASKNYNSIELKYGVNCSIRDCSVIDNWGHGCRISNSLNCDITDCFVRPNNVNVNSGEAYALTLYAATHCRIRSCYIERARHSVLLFTGTAGCEISGCVSVDCRVADYDCHGANEVKNHFHHNLSVGGSSISPDSSFKTSYKVGNPTHVYGSFGNLFEDNRAINISGGCGAQIVPRASGNTFRNNTFINCTYGFQLLQIGSYPTLTGKDNVIENNEVIEAVSGFCNISGSTNFTVQNLTLRNNKSIRNGTHYAIANTSGYLLLNNNSIIDSLSSSTDFGIYLSGCTNAKAIGNNLQTAYDGIRLVGCPSAQLVNNTMLDLLSTNARLNISSSNNVISINNTVSGSSLAPYSVLSGSTGVILDGTTQINGRYASINNGIFQIAGSTAPTTRPGGSTLADGDTWFNPSDRKTYYWSVNALAWLSEESLSLSAAYTNLSSTTNGVQRTILQGGYYWIERIEASGAVVSPNDTTANFWQFRITTQDSASVDTTISGSTINTSTFAVAANAFIGLDINFFLTVTASMVNFRLIAGKAGTTATPGTLTGNAIVYYRKALR